MRKPLAVGAATLAVVLSLGLAACGSDDSSSDEALSNADLIAQADEICTDYNDQLSTIQEERGLNSESPREDVVAYVTDDIIPLYQDQIDELRDLQPNEEDADAYNDIVDTLDTELQAVEDDPDAAIDSENPFSGASEKAQAFGMEVCGSE